MPDAPESLRTDRDGAVAILTLNRPQALNALTGELRRALLSAMKEAARDDEVRAVILTGAGRAFCAGADLRAGAGELDFRRVLTTEYNPLVEFMRDLPKPIVAAVNGVAAGAGFSLAMAADLVVASAEARFVSAFGRIGLVPDSGLARTLVRTLGRHRALEILLGERELSAADAEQLGLVARAVPAEQLHDVALDLARRLASGPTRGIGMTKRLLNASEDASLEEALSVEAALQELAGRTEDHAEGVAAFEEKRAPTFRGR